MSGLLGAGDEDAGVGNTADNDKGNRAPPFDLADDLAPAHGSSVDDDLGDVCEDCENNGTSKISMEIIRRIKPVDCQIRTN